MSVGFDEGFQDVGQRPSLATQCMKVLNSVDISELPILVWMLLCMVWFLVLLSCRKSLVISTVMCLLMCIAIGCTQRVNSFMSNNMMYQSFGFKMNYFDQTCVFTFLFWFCPLAFEMAIFLLLLVVDLLTRNWSETIKDFFVQWRGRRPKAT